MSTITKQDALKMLDDTWMCGADLDRGPARRAAVRAYIAASIDPHEAPASGLPSEEVPTREALANVLYEANGGDRGLPDGLMYNVDQIDYVRGQAFQRYCGMADAILAAFPQMAAAGASAGPVEGT